MEATNTFIWKTFKEWLQEKGSSERTASSVNSRINRIKEAYSVEYEYVKDRCAELLEDLTYTAEDARNGIMCYLFCR